MRPRRLSAEGCKLVIKPAEVLSERAAVARHPECPGSRCNTSADIPRHVHAEDIRGRDEGASDTVADAVRPDKLLVGPLRQGSAEGCGAARIIQRHHTRVPGLRLDIASHRTGAETVLEGRRRLRSTAESVLNRLLRQVGVLGVDLERPALGRGQLESRH
jgi:hypothetical protein